MPKTSSKVKPALVLHHKLVLKAGTHNGVEYSEDEVHKLYLIYKQIEAKSYPERTMDEIHAFDLHRGDDEDHKDSTGTWIGDVNKVYWDDEVKGFGFEEWQIIEEDFAKKVEFQKQRGKSSFGVSPRLNVLRIGTKATEILPKNISIVLSPAGGEDLMLSKGQSGDGKDREIREDIVQELTLSEQETISGGDTVMDEKVLEQLVALTSKLDKAEEAREAAFQAKVKEMDELAKKKKDEEEEMAAKKKKDEEEMQVKKKKEEDELAKKKKDEEEEMAVKKKKDEEEMQDKAKADKKYKYYGALSESESLLKQFSVTPDLTKLDAVSVNRVAEDIVQTAKVFEGEFTLEKAQKGIEELQAILVNLPRDEKQEATILKHVDEVLSSQMDTIASKLGEKAKSGLVHEGRRKGLIVDGSARAEETLSQAGDKKEESSVDDIRSNLVDTFCKGLGISE